jgi:hypothetical protein
MLVQGSANIPAGTYVSGVNATRVYLSAALTGVISLTTAIIFTDTNTSLGIRTGDQITISGSNVSNLDGTWPVTSAGATSTTFNIKTTTSVTASNYKREGTVVRLGTIVLRNANVTLGTSEASATPAAATIKGENGVGTNISGGAFNIQAGLSSGNGTGGVINFKTGTTGSTGDAQQSTVTRMTLAQSAAATTLDLTTAMTTANVFNTTATTVSAFGAGTTIGIGATTGTLTINNPTVVGTQTTQSLYNTTATTINFAGAATAINIGAATGILTIGMPTITGTTATTFNMNGVSPSIVTSSTGTASVFNTNALTGNAFGVATAINLGTSAAALSTLTVGPAITGNIFKVAGTATGTINLTTDVTSGTVNAWQSVTGTTNISSSGNIILGTGAGATTTVQVGGAITGNTLKIAGTAAGTVNVSSDVTTGTVNLFTGVTTGTINIGTGGASTINLGSTSSNVRVGTLSLGDKAYLSSSETLSITDAAATAVDTFATATYRSSKYVVQVTCTAGTDINKYQTSEILCIHDGTTATLTDYAVIRTGNNLVTFTAAINGANVELRAQATTGNTIKVKVVRQLMTL